MFRVIFWICKSLILLNLLGCTYYAEKSNTKNYKTDEPFRKTFYGKYEDVWLAVGKSISHYRTSVMDQEAGYIETIEQNHDEGWKSPTVDNIPPSGRRYKIVIRVLKGESQGREAISVSVKKVILNRVDFFSPDKEEASDGLEEQAILYRVEREYRLKIGLDKYYEKKQAQ